MIADTERPSTLGFVPRLTSRSSCLPIWGLLLHLGSSFEATAAPASDLGRLERMSTSQGLSDERVRSIAQDHRGFLWIATRGGLNLYDGYGFTVFANDPAESDSLSSSHITKIHVDPDGTVWIGTFDGLNRFDVETNRFERFLHDPEDPDSLSDPRIESILRDTSGVLWVGTQRGLNELAADGRRFIRHFASTASATTGADQIRALHEDRGETLWVGTAGAGLRRWDRQTGEIRTLQDPGSGLAMNAHVSCFHQGRDGTLWIGSDAGLWSLDPASERLRLRLPESVQSQRFGVTAIHEDRDGSLWVGTEYDGILSFDPASGTLGHYRSAPSDSASLSSNRIGALFLDATGVLWVGTEGGGINRIVREHLNFELLRHDPTNPASLINNQVRAVHVDSARRLWVGTEAGLSCIEPEADQTIHYLHDPSDADSLSSDRISSIAEDHSGRLWIGTRDRGLNRLNGDRARFTRFLRDSENPGSLIHDDVSVLHLTESGSLWVGTLGGLARLELPSEQFFAYRHDPADSTSLSNNRITAIQEDSSGMLWIGTYVGLNRLDPSTGHVRRIVRDPSRPDSLNDNRIWSIYERSPGELWIGTSSGINRLDVASERFTHFGARPGSRSDRVYGVLGDAAGKLWLGTDRTLSKLDPVTKKFHDYDVSDGLQGGPFNPGAYYATPEGELFFGGHNGLNRFHPLSMQAEAPSPIALTAFKKLNKDGDTDRFPPYIDQISLSHKDYFITLEFAVLDFRRSEENRHAYRLEGFDEDWIDIGTRRSATYTNLPAGRYLFQAKGSNSEGVWTEENLTIAVEVTPPFWATSWFRLIALVTIGTLGALIFRLRTRSIQLRNRQLEQSNQLLNAEIARRTKAEEEKQLVIAELETRSAEMESFTYSTSHDLRSPLITIESFLGLVKQGIARGDLDRAMADMERITNATKKMSRLLDELLRLSRVGRLENDRELVSLSKLANEAAELATGRIDASGAEVAINPDLPTVYGDRQRLLEALMNLIDNAAKFIGSSPEPKIEINCRESGDETIYIVRDNGLGIDPRYHDKIFQVFEQLSPEHGGTGMGLALVRRIVQAHGGRIWVESDGLGSGSAFCFTLAEEAKAPVQAIDPQ